ncbi:hypothetical protein [Lentibacillus salicampi]|uniref:Uncharacterized protein n=1 Tax=Lentibacillus salicampi TaxID=175306 RepID=A0A4Y9A723_9BACI|nr:hypothetical protein [Lentibacillus salicampi]TFJ91516.1 hypothetical protein E4U82_17165 [Lentibacillus salicampi]
MLVINNTKKQLKQVEPATALQKLNAKDYVEMTKFLKRISTDHSVNRFSLCFYQYEERHGLIAVVKVESRDVGKVQLVADNIG